MFILYMLSMTNDKTEWIKYLTFFSLFNPSAIIKNNWLAISSIGLIFVLASGLYISSLIYFTKKDLPI
jgi:ABC-2 type transport system permease protein